MLVCEKIHTKNILNISVLIEMKNKEILNSFFYDLIIGVDKSH